MQYSGLATRKNISRMRTVLLQTDASFKGYAMVVALLILIACILLFGAAKVSGAIATALAWVGGVVLFAGVGTAIMIYFDIESFNYADIFPYLLGLLALIAVLGVWANSKQKK